MVVGLIILSTFCVRVTFQQEYYPTAENGAVWPKPSFEKEFPVVFLYDSESFEFNVSHHNCNLIQDAIARFNKSMKALVNNTKSQRTEENILEPSMTSPETLKRLIITLNNPCEYYPHHEMTESYYLTVSETSMLISASIWGILRGFETFSQLFNLSSDDFEVFVRAMEIFDEPRYAHRGLVLDTSQHYIPVASIVRTLRTMAMHKLNVLHWRFADDGSLVNKRANRTVKVYSKKNIRNIIQYARTLGIRVIPEFDLPVHMGPKSYSANETNDTINTSLNLHPFSTTTYVQLSKLYGEVQLIFPEKYLHLGLVDLYNWVEDPKVKLYLEEHDENVKKLHYLYLQKIQEVLKNESIPVVWQSTNDVEKSLPFNFIIQADTKKGWLIRNIQQIQKGRQVVSLISINQENLTYMIRNRFKEYYKEDLRTKWYDITKDHKDEENLLGLEAIIEPDVLDKNGNIVRSAWVAISAIAEVLWSNIDGEVPQNHIYRMAEQDIRLFLRGAYFGVADVDVYKDEKSIPEDVMSHSSNADNKLNVNLKHQDIKEWLLLVSSLLSFN